MAVPDGIEPEDYEPSAEDLDAIERESGLIAAELALLDAEIRILHAKGDRSEVDWQRLRNAMCDVLSEPPSCTPRTPTKLTTTRTRPRNGQHEHTARHDRSRLGVRGRDPRRCGVGSGERRPLVRAAVRCSDRLDTAIRGRRRGGVLAGRPVRRDRNPGAHSVAVGSAVGRAPVRRTGAGRRGRCGGVVPAPGGIAGVLPGGPAHGRHRPPRGGRAHGDGDRITDRHKCTLPTRTAAGCTEGVCVPYRYASHAANPDPYRCRPDRRAGRRTA